MKVTGTLIKNEIKILTMELASLNNTFASSLMYFEEDGKPDVPVLADDILRLENKLAIWQAAQKHFNTMVSFTFGARKIFLQEAISAVGGYGRVAKLMRGAAGAEKDKYGGRRYSNPAISRGLNEIVAKPSITRGEAVVEFKNIEKLANDLRVGIGISNNIEVDMAWLDSALASL